MKNIKIEIRGNETVSPELGDILRATDTNTVVLVTKLYATKSAFGGVVLFSGRTDHDVGYYRKDWFGSNFIPFKGVITITVD